MDCNRNQSEPLQKLYCRYFHDILSFDGVSTEMCQLLWLFRSGKLVEYKERTYSLHSEGKVLASEGCRVN